MAAKLIYQIRGQQITFLLDKDEILIGRSATNDLVIEHPSVSRRHARLVREGEYWRASDLGSKYGTRVNNLKHTDRPLQHGDTIHLHDFKLVFTSSARPAVELTPRASTRDDPTMQTVFQPAVNFSTLAAAPDVQRLQRLLAIVTKASESLLTSSVLDDTLNRVLDIVFEHLPVQRGFIMLWEDDKQDLVTRAVKHDPSITDTGEIRFSRTIAERVYRDKVSVLTTDAMSDDRFAGGASIFDLGIRSAMAAPLWHGDSVDGLIYVDTLLQKRAFDKFDLDLLSALGNHVAVALEQARLQQSIMEQQLVRRRLERYHSPAVVERITSRKEGEGALVADEREVTVLFADVVGFTPRCETLEPREVAELLNRYFSEMAEAIFRHEGMLDKFIGDCLMAVFGAPFSTEDHPRLAVEAALDMREALNQLNRPMPRESWLEVRIGMHSGRVIAGDIGSLKRSDYTVLGATVNLASRIESSVARPGQIVISETTADALPSGYETRFVGEHQPKGTARPVRCFEMLGRAAEPTT